ncbi:ABC transporter ATP-binding protein [Quadrisphaera sp. DSM 44207]|uniref:ABC transporter ATP-binding protein n=1 Tax=Quadrisphaera sp. DSM 44207 TaxID=1881057 RepID=UPI00088DF2D6|nr:ATP-binding cassette domain-containing protein [Quadrisphaera sp. DSM 44207]SDQ78518.1 ABC-2 type transport system ATP-binding protein [Quadrisphaera sp. DSM 44207]
MLEIIGLTKRFGAAPALDDVSFAVRPGRMTGFVGANGAGKTTAMRVVLGVTPPDAGEVRWRGRPVDADARAGFGYMPEERGLYPKMRVLDQLVFFARLHGLDAAEGRERAVALLAELGIAQRAGDVLDGLSLGNQQRVQVAAALVHDPELLVLDEPFSGLDPIAVDAMAGLLRARASAGVPVLFSSHQLDLVERLCDDVVVLDHGRVVASGEAEELRRSRSPLRYRIVVEPDAGFLREEPGLHVLDVSGAAALVQLDGAAGGAAGGPDGASAAGRVEDPAAAEQRLLARASAAGAVREFRPVVPTLSELFREVVR